MRKVGLVVLNAAVLAWFVVPERLRIDLNVYRLGADLWLAGGDLYGLLPPTIIGNHLPFTYPPIAAVLFTPLTPMPHAVAGVLLTLLSVAALALVVILVLRALDLPSWLAGLVLPVAMVLEPVRVTLYFGQINLLLMALVAADCLVRHPRWPRGALIGLAAAIKLTPIAFVLFFLLRGNRKAAVTAIVSFFACTAVGFLANPAGSVKYWTSTVFNPNRIGKVTQESNQSINGVLSRLGIERGALWLVLVAVVVVLGVLAVRHASNDVEAMGRTGLIVLLVSPVSWSHHWVWAVPLLLACLRTRLAVAGTLVFLLSPHWWWDADNGTTWLTATVGNAYFWCAAGVLAWSAHRQFRRPRVHVDHRAVA